MKFFLFKEFLKINSLLNQKIKFKLFISVIVYFLCNQNSSAEVKKIQHPFAEKGLTKIEADGTYVYKVDLLEKTQTGILRIGTMDAPQIVSNDGKTSFSQMYGEGSHSIFLYDYEWQPLNKWGKLGFQFGFGLFAATGPGHFADGTESIEKYNFYVVPLNFGVVYRLEFLQKQWFAPYVSGGGTYNLVIEMRDDNEKTNYLGVAGAYVAAGAMLDITAFDRDTALIMNKEYDLGKLWITFEYRRVQTARNDVEMSSNVVSVGFGADY